MPSIFVDFNDLYNVQNLHKKITTSCVVCGKTPIPYSIPLKIEVENLKGKIIKIGYPRFDLLRFVDYSQDRIDQYLGKKLGIKGIRYTVLEYQFIHRIFMLPKTGQGKKNKVVTACVGFYIGSDIGTNKSYNLTGYLVTDPTDQKVIFLCHKKNLLVSSVENFKMTPVIRKKLDLSIKYDLTDANSIYKYLEMLYDGYASNITNIYQRFDLHLAVDLAFHSVVSFKFANELVKKGWADIMVVGDTRCGKGYVAERLVEYFQLGEIISGDNISFVGLVGGLQQHGGSWTITWGKLPLNDNGLLLIDEAGELKPSDWSKLSRIRSEGIAEITKIMSQRVDARTRLIWLANPPSKIIANYSYGIQSLIDLIWTMEDIARFDYVLIVANNEVPIEIINQEQCKIKLLHSQERDNLLVRWVWSRSVDQIQFTNEAIDFIYSQAIRLANIYSIEIPLIQGENIRIKLARLAVMFAGRLFSNIESGEILHVKKCHVECGLLFYRLIYGKRASGYLALSKSHKKQFVAETGTFDGIKKYINSFANKDELYRCLLENNIITVNRISEHNNLPPEIGREVISKLLQSGSIVFERTNSYSKTAAFSTWLKEQI